MSEDNKQEERKPKKHELLKEGDKCPDVTLHIISSSKPEKKKLKDIVECHIATVLFFFPKAGTSACTRETCEFNHAYQELKGKDIEMIGISHDSPEKLRVFRERNSIEYLFASDSDPEDSISDAFGVRPSSWFGLRPQERVTFVINNEGIIKSVFTGQHNYTEHVSKATQCIRNIINNT